MEYDPDLREVTGPAGRVVLPRQQGEIFALLIARPGRLLSRDALVGRLYDDKPDNPPDDRALDVAVWRLRERLRQAGVAGHIATVRSSGWVWRPGA